jgi:hypothetical protein
LLLEAVYLVLLAPAVRLAQPAQPDRKVMLVIKAVQVHKVMLARVVLQAQLVLLQLARQVTKAVQDHKALNHKARQVLLAIAALKVLLQLAQPVQRVQ